MSRTNDPELEFGDPRKLADDPALTTRQKLKILEDWKLDLLELQKAEEENMPSVGAEPEATARKLAEVTRVMEAIVHRAEDPGKASPGAPPPKPPKPRKGNPGGQPVPDPVPVDSPRPATPKGPID